MADYVSSMAMKECEKEVPTADVLRAEIEEYIAARGCEGYVAPQTITDYVPFNRQGFLACECMNRKNRAHDQRPEALALCYGGSRLLQSDAGRLQPYHADYQPALKMSAPRRKTLS